IVKEGGDVALRTFLLTFVAATAAVVALELIEVVLSRLNMNPLGPTIPRQLEGFSQNRNFFAFQILMAISAGAVVIEYRPAARIAILSLMMAGLYFTGSRSGWIALVFVLGAVVYMRAAGVREVALSVMGAALLSAAVIATGFVPGVAPTDTTLFPEIVPTEMDSKERLVTMIGGLKMFADHPIFGAGLGAFRNQLILASSGIPLLIHSTAIWLLAEMGIVGFLAFVLPALCLLV